MKAPGHLDEIFFLEAFRFAVDRHLVPIRPLPAGVVAPDHIECRCQSPAAGGVHEKAEVAGVVVLVAGDGIENHSAEQLGNRGLSQMQSLADGHGRLVAGAAGLAEIIVPQRTQ